jgi:hypothetical protein
VGIVEAHWQGLKEFEKALESLGQGRARAVVASTVKESLARGKTLSARAVVSKYNIKYGQVLGGMKTHNGGMTGEIVASSPELKSITYKPKPGSPQPKRHPVININVLKGKSTPWPGAFVAKMKSGHVGVFTRKEASRLPIVERSSIGPGQEFLSHRQGLDVTIPNQVAEFYCERLASKTLAALGGAAFQ